MRRAQKEDSTHTHTPVPLDEFICVKFKCKYLRVLKGVFRASICPHIAATQYRCWPNTVVAQRWQAYEYIATVQHGHIDWSHPNPTHLPFPAL